MTTPLIVAAACLVFALVLFWIGFRLAFPKDVSGGLRALSLVIVLGLWTQSVRQTALELYNFFHQITLFVMTSNGRAPGDQTRMTDQACEYLVQIPWLQLFLAFLTLILLVRLFAAIKDGTAPQWIAKVRSTNLTLRLNALVFIVFFAGIYLSVASLCTIPTLQVNQPFSDVERNQINTEIDGYNPSDDVFNKQFPLLPGSQSDEVLPLRTLVSKAGGGDLSPQCDLGSTPPTSEIPGADPPTSKAKDAPAPAAPPVLSTATTDAMSQDVKTLKERPAFLANIRQTVRDYDAKRCSQLSQYHDMRSTAQQIIRNEAGKIKDQVNSNFALRLTGRDRADYLYTLKSGYGNLSNSILATLGRCRSAVQSGSLSYSYAVDYYERALHVPPATTTMVSTPSEAPQWEIVDNSPGPCVFDRLSWTSITAAPVPRLGIFSFFFGWLEDSDSLALAVLCGMLGVGLVGCIVSTFVRQQGDRAVGAPWISNTFPVIVRGFTAAVVVYLAIEGGLNIFSTGSNQANPYVLLFGCLVGAVFSDDVWRAAREHLRSADHVPGDDGSDPGDAINPAQTGSAAAIVTRDPVHQKLPPQTATTTDPNKPA